MSLNAEQISQLFLAYYDHFNPDIQKGIYNNQRDFRRVAACFTHLKGYCELYNDAYDADLITFTLNTDGRTLFGFYLDGIRISDFDKAQSLLEELGLKAAEKYRNYSYNDYVQDIRQYGCDRLAQGDMNLREFAQHCMADGYLDNDLEFGELGEFDWSSDDELDDLLDCFSDSSSSPQEDTNTGFVQRTDVSKLYGIKIKQLIESGDSDVQELLENLAWMVRAAQDAKDESASNEQVIVDDALFLAAACGSVGFCKHLAKVFDIPAFLVRFPQQVTDTRMRQLQLVDERTSEITSGSKRGSSSNWFSLAEFLYKPKLSFDGPVIAFLTQLLGRTKDGSIVFALDKSELVEIASTNLFARFVSDNTNRHSATKFREAKQVQQALYQRVIGQPEAVSSVSAAMASLLVNGGTQHLGVSTFMGPSGTGKTMMAESIAEVFTDELELDYQLVVFNMEQYSDRRDVMKLFGSGSQYVDSALGDLTLALVKNPRAVVLFDEIEKAHPEVIQSLLTLTDKGTAEDRTTGQVVDFSMACLLFTTNLGSEVIARHSADKPLDVLELLTRKRGTSERTLSAEMANRLAAGNVAMFKPFDPNSLVKIAQRAADKAKKESTVSWPDNTCELVLATLGGQVSPRAISTQISKLEGLLFNELLSNLSDENVHCMQDTRIAPTPLIPSSEAEIAILSRDAMFSQLDNPAVKHVANIAADTLQQLFASNIDVLVIDENTMQTHFSLISKHLADCVNKTVLTLSRTHDTSQLDDNCGYGIALDHFTLPSTRCTAAMTEVVERAVRIAQVIGYTRRALARNTTVSFQFEHKVHQSSVEARITDLQTRQTVRTEDAELPFISFAGKPTGSLDDVIGYDGVKAHLQLIIKSMTNDKFAESAKITVPKGYLFSGEPGTGKTHMARCVAADSDMFFFNVNAGDLLIGNAVDNINRLFAIARRYAPSLLFIDEIDSIAKNRSKVSHESAVVVNTLLTAMDGFNAHPEKVFIMAATNNPQELDPALMRDGRFERTVKFDLPCQTAREHCVSRWLASKSVQLDSRQVKELASLLQGATIGRIEEIFNNSVLSALATGKEWHPDMLAEAARSAVLGGVNAMPGRSQAQIYKTACHETGHLLAHTLLFPDVPIDYVSVQPRGAALGMVVPGSSDSPTPVSKQMVQASLQICLAGIAAEKLLGLSDDIQSIGGTDDRRKATLLAKTAIMEWGMSSNFGLIIPAELTISADDVNTEIKTWLMSAFESVTQLLREHKAKLLFIADELVAKEHLDKADIESVLAQYDAKSGSKTAA